MYGYHNRIGIDMEMERMLNITLQQMKYAVEVCRAGSISQAAKNLYMNQPNLSKAMKDLEQELGITLFSRTPKGILPSREGLLFLEYAEEIFQKLDELEASLYSHRTTALSFNISIPRASYITHAFTQFVKNASDTSQIKINYRETNATEAIENLLTQHFNLGIVRYTQPFESEIQQLRSRTDITSKVIWQSEYVLIFSKQHPLASYDKICLSDLAPYTELIHGDENPVQMMPDTPASRQISLYERGSQFDFLRNVPTTYMWVSPIPSDILSQNELVQKKCYDSHAAFCDLLITRSGHALSAFSKNFITVLEQVRDETASDVL